MGRRIGRLGGGVNASGDGASAGLDAGAARPYHGRTLMSTHGDPATPGHRHGASRPLRDALTAYLYISPAAIIIGVFGIFPLFFTLFVSLFRWRLARGPFSGLDNYARLFGGNILPLLVTLAAVGCAVLAGSLLRSRSGARRRPRRVAGIALLVVSLSVLALSLPHLVAQGDSEAFDALRVTIWYSICTVVPQIAAGLALAVLLTRSIRGKQAFRVIYLLPYIAPTVATAAVFELLFSLRPDSFANQVLRLLGTGPLQWLQEPRGIFSLLAGSSAAPSLAPTVVQTYWAGWASGPSLALTAIVLYSWWVFVGYYALIYINGLSAIPRQLYEAAEVDGAGRLRSFFSITIPLLSPTTYFLSLLGVIGTFKAFTHLYVLRSSAAAGAADPLSVMIFFTAFRKGNMGYASAVSVLLFVLVLGLSIVQQRTTERGVSYGD
jgi:multiple sugar transport system permease protein